MDIPAFLFITIRSESSCIISNLKLYGFNEVFFGSGISRVTLSPTDILFEGLFKIELFNLSFLFKIKFLTLVLLKLPSLLETNESIR